MTFTSRKTRPHPCTAAAFLAATIVFTSGASPANPPSISAESILARTKILSSDEFEGRAPGSAGEEKTVAYLIGEFKKLGLQPGNPDGTFTQAVPFTGITTTIQTAFETTGGSLEPQPMTEYVARTQRAVPSFQLKDTEIVFCGYGVMAPEYQWDDFKGVDVRGKTIVVLVNDPPQRDPQDPTKLDDTVFKGNAMTYYGRWDYKYDQAAALGAAACLIVHETGPAGYPFAVLGSRWGQEEFDLRTPDRNAHAIGVQGWLTLDFARRLFKASGQDYDALKTAANSRDFRPVPLSSKVSFAVQNKLREVDSRNVVAKLEGSDSKLKNECVVYTAHWDHLGRDARLKGDQIFNGAFDNASGTAALIEIAGAFAAQDPRPRRSIVFLAVTGEERGLLGAKYYAEHPLYPLERTLANINMDRVQVFGRSRDLEVVGYGNSTIDDLATEILARNHRVLVPDTAPEKGYFYRSDHFEFAKKGVPAFYSKFGRDLLDYPPGTGASADDAYTANDYHKVSDEVKPSWDFRGAAEDVKFLTELGATIANGDRWPEWKPGTEFKARREASLKTAKR
jgi:Zn-dependent M28 family amino/carboxypeptidase